MFKGNATMKYEIRFHNWITVKLRHKNEANLEFWWCITGKCTEPWYKAVKSTCFFFRKVSVVKELVNQWTINFDLVDWQINEDEKFKQLTIYLVQNIFGLLSLVWLNCFQDETALRLVESSLRTSEYRPINIFVNFYSGISAI